MPELPEIYNISNQMNKELSCKIFTDVEIRQDKCLNRPEGEFKTLLIGHKIQSIYSKGKWIYIECTNNLYLLLSLGMGGNVLYHNSETNNIPKKYQIKLDFDDKSCLTIRFWWFGYAHILEKSELKNHKMTFTLGASPLDKENFTFDYFLQLLNGKKAGIKNFLLNQKNIAGIGNVYIQDILFQAKLHPERKISSLSLSEKELLYNAIVNNLNIAVSQGGIAYEKDIYNRPGRIFTFLVGYNDGKSCPECGSTIQKIKTGSTSSYICSTCQKC